MSSGLQAVILAGGKGTRLRPYTVSLPKPLVPVGDLPIAEILIKQLKAAGVDDIVVSTGHLAGIIEAYFGDGARFGIKIRYARESKPLGTAGALKLVTGLQENFLVLNGDILTSLDFKALMDFHKSRKALATLSVHPREVGIDFGIIKVGDKGEFVDYIEKPQYQYTVSMGVNVFHRRVQEFIKDGEEIGMPDLIKRLHGASEPVACYRFDGEWLDIGRIDDYQRAQDLFQGNAQKFLPKP